MLGELISITLFLSFIVMVISLISGADITLKCLLFQKEIKENKKEHKGLKAYQHS